MTKKKVAPLAHTHSHADHRKNLNSLNRIIGQIEGIQKMITEQRYCTDILMQTRAAAAALKKVELTILQSHVEHCVRDAFLEKNPNRSAEKIQELMRVMERY